MNFLAVPRARRVEGSIRAPSSKSATNRALVLAALSHKPVLVASPLESDDTEALARCLRAMGARIEETRDGFSVGGPLAADASTETLLDAADSGTAARFLAAVAAATPGRFRLDGSARLRERPMAELLDALRSAGAQLECGQREGFLPVSIRGGSLRGGPIVVDASRSSQFLSSLLIAAAAVPGRLTARPSGEVASSPYVDATVEALEAFGHRVTREGSSFTVERGSSGPSRYEVPGDHSSAVPLLAAAGAATGRVTVLGVSRRSVAADARALPVLEAMGIRVEEGQGGLTASFEGRSLEPVRIEAGDFPDSVPALAALAALARGESRFGGIGHLRHKESDRIEALAALLAAAGGGVRAGADELIVAGGLETRPAASLPTANDHRIAMAAALLALARGPHLVESPGCVAKSYPSFFRDLATLIRTDPS